MFPPDLRSEISLNIYQILMCTFPLSLNSPHSFFSQYFTEYHDGMIVNRHPISRPGTLHFFKIQLSIPLQLPQYNTIQYKIHVLIHVLIHVHVLIHALAHFTGSKAHTAVKP